MDSRELSELAALERLEGPQGEDRADWRAAFVAYAILLALGGTKGIGLTDVYGMLIAEMRKVYRPVVVEIVEDDPEASAARAAELKTKMAGIVEQIIARQKGTAG